MSDKLTVEISGFRAYEKVTLQGFATVYVPALRLHIGDVTIHLFRRRERANERRRRDNPRHGACLRRPRPSGAAGLVAGAEERPPHPGLSTIYALMAEGKFLSPIRLGPKAVGWLRSDLEAWVESRPLARRARLIRQERQASEAP